MCDVIISCRRPRGRLMNVWKSEGKGQSSRAKGDMKRMIRYLFREAYESKVDKGNTKRLFLLNQRFEYE